MFRPIVRRLLRAVGKSEESGRWWLDTPTILTRWNIVGYVTLFHCNYNVFCSGNNRGLIATSQFSCEIHVYHLQLIHLHCILRNSLLENVFPSSANVGRLKINIHRHYYSLLMAHTYGVRMNSEASTEWEQEKWRLYMHFNNPATTVSMWFSKQTLVAI